MHLKKAAAFSAFLLAWQIAAQGNAVLPTPLEVGSALAGMPGGELAAHVAASLNHVILGFFAGAGIGLTAGIALALLPSLEDYFSVFIELARPIPPVAWIPLAILWFGIGDGPAYFLVALGVFFPVFTNTYHGVKNIDQKLVLSAKSFGASDKLLLFEVVLPAVLPHAFNGLKIGLGVGWMIVVTAELVGATAGLGYMIQLNRMLAQVDNVVLGMAVIGVVGLALQGVLNAVEEIVMPWRTEQ
ncbi:ABC transporter permease [Candidatus Micrarchaeota archaeon]|nr:ABC transporter permease [Candidatus Micrarchaeota archaeon]